MRNIRLIIEYDGTNYCGWQIQNRKTRKLRPKTLQETIEKVLKNILKEKINLIASGRTDSGVHAEGQVANFKTKSKIPAKNIQKILNGLLPNDISILDAEDVPLDFHARFSAKCKTYRYLILNQDYPSALLHARCHRVSYKLSISDMRQAAKMLLGKHDFAVFCASGSSVKSTIRSIKKIDIIRLNKERNCRLIAINIEADGFLYNMVRAIVGTLVDIARGKKNPGLIRKILSSQQRNLIGPTAPACGLYLLKVTY